MATTSLSVKGLRDWLRSIEIDVDTTNILEGTYTKKIAINAKHFYIHVEEVTFFLI